MSDWIQIATQEEVFADCLLEWIIEYSPEKRKYRCSCFRNNHFVENIVFDEYDKSDDRK